MSHVVHKYTINFSSETCSSHSQQCLTSCDLSVKWVETKHLIYGSRPKHLCCRRGNSLGVKRCRPPAKTGYFRQPSTFCQVDNVFNADRFG